jgi:cell division protein FtsL
MSRIVNLVLLIVMLIGAIVTYNMKLEAEKDAERVVRLERAIAEQKDAIQLLRAEFSALVQPGRLQAVVERHKEYFQLQDFELSQYATVEEIPLKSFEPQAEATTADADGGNGGNIQ